MTEPEHLRAVRTVYDSSADRYVEFVGTRINPEREAPIDQAFFDTLVAELRAGPAPVGTVIDVGCGPGRASARLAATGIDTLGVDPSNGMLAEARAAHPDLRFETGSLTDLPTGDGSMAAAVCWYSIIYTPPDQLADAWNELRRVLGPGGPLLLGFQAGDGESTEVAAAGGTSIALEVFRHEPDVVAGQLETAGFEVRARARRGPMLDGETTDQAFLLARRGDDRAVG